ncbi:unnamed protein product, partial [Cuscuta campestris]
MELLRCVACLSRRDSFHNFDVAKLVRLSQFYPNDFSEVHAKELQNQLETYIMDVTSDDRFSNLNGLGDLSTVLVETKKHTTFPLVYKLLKLSLVLPVATAGVERCFSAMNLVKTYLRNRIGDEFFSDCLLSYVEKDMLERVENETVIDRFQKMKTRRGSRVTFIRGEHRPAGRPVATGQPATTAARSSWKFLVAVDRRAGRRPPASLPVPPLQNAAAARLLARRRHLTGGQ